MTSVWVKGVPFVFALRVCTRECASTQRETNFTMTVCIT